MKTEEHEQNFPHLLILLPLLPWIDPASAWPVSQHIVTNKNTKATLKYVDARATTVTLGRSCWGWAMSRHTDTSKATLTCVDARATTVTFDNPIWAWALSRHTDTSRVTLKCVDARATTVTLDRSCLGLGYVSTH